jgi:hypothetical protein
MQEDGSEKKGYRVKLYQLEADGAWVDIGTGNLICSYVEELKAPALILTSEDDPQHVLLMSKIQLDDIYERQGGKLMDSYATDAVQLMMMIAWLCREHHYVER